jgi:hypothetical protein
MELQAPGIHRVDVCGSVLKYAIGKPSRRRADIQHGHSSRIDPELIKRVRQFLSTARNEAGAGAQYDLLIVPQLLTCHRPTVRQWQGNFPCHYQRPSLIDTIRKAFIDHQLIKT